MRTKAQIHCLTGHTNTVADVRTQATDPEVKFYYYFQKYIYICTIHFFLFR